jgi:hypothetical protein
MNHKIKIALLIAGLVILAFPGTALAKDFLDDRVVAGGTFTLESGEVLDGSLIIFGGSATVEPEATVQGEVVVIGGIAAIEGHIEGSVIGIGGVVVLSETAVVEGELSTIGATLNRDPLAIVEGQVITGISIPNLSFVPTDISIPGLPDFRPVIRETYDPIWRGSWFILRSLIWAALAALIVMFIPNPTERISRTAVKQPVLSGGVGCLTTVVAPLVLILLAITLILIPVSLIAALVLVVAWFYGRIAIGLEIGRRIGRLFDRNWPAPLAAGAGTLLLSIVVDGSGSFIPCVGWILPAIVGFVALGSVVLSRFGTQVYPQGDGDLALSRTPSDPSLQRTPGEPSETGEGIASADATQTVDDTSQE